MGKFRKFSYLAIFAAGATGSVRYANFMNYGPKRPFSSMTKSMLNENPYDIVIVGAGIVGLATAREISLRAPHLSVAVLDKENAISAHQTKYNSGIIHCGIYYAPNSFKARMCTQGNKEIYDYCDSNGIECKRVGKLIVAVKESEFEALQKLYENGQINNVTGLQWLDSNEEITAIEPLCKGGLKAIWCPTTGIVNYGTVAQQFVDDFLANGSDNSLLLNCEVSDFIEDESSNLIHIHTKQNPNKAIQTKHVITCAGVYADRLAMKSGGKKDPQMIPMRGNYLTTDTTRLPIKTNIYPVPNPSLPVLGVHLTPTLDGYVILGPGATLALGREQYRYEWSQVNLFDIWQIITYSGFWKLAFRFWQYGMSELYRELRMAAQLKRLQAYVPDLKLSDIIVEKKKTGIRAQALDRNGAMIHDFMFESGGNGRFFHVRNAASPACTASLSIGRLITDKAMAQFTNLPDSDEKDTNKTL